MLDAIVGHFGGHFYAPLRRFRVRSNRDLVEMLLHLHQIPKLLYPGKRGTGRVSPNAAVLQSKIRV